MTVITLLTDFGSRNGFSGMMKGVIWKIAPGVRIADITHDIPPQDIREGAITLLRVVPFFPPGTIHVAVVDPGVGTERRGVAVGIGGHFFVGPDNGLFTYLLDQADKENLPSTLINLTKPQYWLPSVSATFHGRDVFSPVAAHLANGVALEELGVPFDDPVRLSLARPQKIQGGWKGEVILIDAFGNIATNLPVGLVKEPARCLVRLAGQVTRGLINTYGAGRAGDVVALVDSRGYIEVAVVNGNGARKLGIAIGDPVELLMQD